MKLNWKWIVVISLVIAVAAFVFVWQFVAPTGGYGMMMRGYGMPMMGGYGMIVPFGMWFIWLIPLGAFILVGFAAGWAAQQFTRKSSD